MSPRQLSARRFRQTWRCEATCLLGGSHGWNWRNRYLHAHLSPSPRLFPLARWMHCTCHRADTCYAPVKKSCSPVTTGRWSVQHGQWKHPCSVWNVAEACFAKAAQRAWRDSRFALRRLGRNGRCRPPGRDQGTGVEKKGVCRKAAPWASNLLAGLNASWNSALKSCVPRRNQTDSTAPGWLRRRGLQAASTVFGRACNARFKVAGASEASYIDIGNTARENPPTPAEFIHVLE